MTDTPVAGRSGRDGARSRAVLLAAPLLGLMALAFFAPILWLLAMSVYDPTVARGLPATAEALAGWSGDGNAPAAVYPAFAADLGAAREAGTLLDLARALNTRLPGIRSRVVSAARANIDPAAADEARFAALHKSWVDPATWRAVQASTSPWTGFHLLAALDLRVGADGSIERVPAEQAIFLKVFQRTFLLAAAVTLLTLILAFPVAYFAAQAPRPLATLILALVLLPFWTSMLVRTASWMVLLQKEGAVNQILALFGLGPLSLMYSTSGLLIAMMHIQLPFTFLPIYSVMKNIPTQQLKAAYSLGAPPLTAFRRIYLPQAMPGVAAGCLLTFILSLGYYITPALIGGPQDQVISNSVANYINAELNWHMAAALSVVLLAFTFVLYAAFGRYLAPSSLKAK
ncbi:ABC transporter permease [Ancylobacter sonchi]|uniref:ABC transporter permease n=1 Tax=Ancylobacter sonchi TaxID=1937790 RepID=UPI001BD1E52F|nr:ABC transporter permease [Ancylobacter sonchi]MBS7534266.1 ABC transporter permease [Ancylobacter sonchi]